MLRNQENKERKSKYVEIVKNKVIIQKFKNILKLFQNGIKDKIYERSILKGLFMVYSLIFSEPLFS